MTFLIFISVSAFIMLTLLATGLGLYFSSFSSFLMWFGILQALLLLFIALNRRNF